jgi:PAS domain-containing protein
MPAVILRIVLGTLPNGRDAAALLAVRDRLARAAAGVAGLESLVIAARSAPSRDDGSASVPLEAAIVTAWSDLTAMSRAVEADEARFISDRFDLPFTATVTERYDVVGRTFAALPPESTAYLRILTVRAPSADEQRLVHTLQAQQPRLADLGIIASHVARRRLDDGSVEAVHVSVWPDRATLRSATHGMFDQPLFAPELESWWGHTRVEMYDAIEIAPRLPHASGPPLAILDEDRRIVDVTATAAAILGVPPGDLVGRRLDELANAEETALPEIWDRLLATGSAKGA